MNEWMNLPMKHLKKQLSSLQFEELDRIIYVKIIESKEKEKERCYHFGQHPLKLLEE